MSENDCTHDCSSCSESCSQRSSPIEKEAPNPASHIKHVIGIVSGKGGVGKSAVAAMLATIMNRRANSVAILDADITGPSIPKAFGIKDEVTSTGDALIAPVSKTGIKIMSVNLLLEDETSPVVWRGPIIAGTVKQFWSDVIWDDVDYMFVDMPPGTGDVPLTVFQSIPLDGIIIVTTPQELVSMIVKKAVNMARLMNIPVLGMIENMAYVTCPDCSKRIDIFGESRADAVADECSVKLLARVPVDPKISALCDRGIIELMENDYLESACDEIEAALEG